MAEYVEKGTLHETIAKLEKLARDRYLDTPWDSPVRTRYQAQLNERTNLKYLIFDLPAADVAPVRHEKWEVIVGSDGKEHMVCTGCRKQQDLTGVFSYCPNCGAKMDGDG